MEKPTAEEWKPPELDTYRKILTDEGGEKRDPKEALKDHLDVAKCAGWRAEDLPKLVAYLDNPRTDTQVCCSWVVVRVLLCCCSYAVVRVCSFVFLFEQKQS